jgi:DNA-binding MarR family transcriptional regulator
LNPSEPDTSEELEGGLLDLTRSFKNAYRSADRRKGQETHSLAGGEVSRTQFELLVELHKNGPMAVGELAQASATSPASVSQMVDRLSERGLVARVRSEEDRRVVKVEISELGRDGIRPVILAWRKRWRETFADLPEEDMATASRVLDRIASIYED